MKGLSITGLVLGLLGPLVLVAPLIPAPLGDETYWQVGWVFFFFTVPLGVLLEIAGAVLVIVAAGLALRRGFRPRAVPITGICLTAAGLLLQAFAILLVVSVSGSGPPLLVAVGMVVSVTGVIMSAVAGIRQGSRWVA
jgi:hypothetical protein